VSQTSGKLDWVVGVFYQCSETHFDLLQLMPGISDYTNAALGTGNVNFSDTLATGGAYQTFEDLAFFGEPMYHITDRWQVTAGVRIFRQELSGWSGVLLPYASRVLQFFMEGGSCVSFGPWPAKLGRICRIRRRRRGVRAKRPTGCHQRGHRDIHTLRHVDVYCVQVWSPDPQRDGSMNCKGTSDRVFDRAGRSPALSWAPG